MKRIFTFILEQDLDEIPSYCSDCGKVHGTEACVYDDDEDGVEAALAAQPQKETGDAEI